MEACTNIGQLSRDVRQGLLAAGQRVVDREVLGRFPHVQASEADAVRERRVEGPRERRRVGHGEPVRERRVPLCQKAHRRRRVQERGHEGPAVAPRQITGKFPIRDHIPLLGPRHQRTGSEAIQHVPQMSPQRVLRPLVVVPKTLAVAPLKDLRGPFIELRRERLLDGRQSTHGARRVLRGPEGPHPRRLGRVRFQSRDDARREARS